MKKLVTRFLLRTQGTRTTFPPYPGGSSSASNHRASRPTAAARAVSVACYAAAGLLVAVAGLLALPLPAQAQKTTFVSNTGQSTDPDVREVGPHGHLWQLQAQQFRTGDNEGGYTLSTIQVRVDDFGSNSRPKVSIYTTSSGNPGSSLYVLTNPATLNDDAINSFRAPANATLEKDTNYFVVFEALGSGSNLRYDLEVTTSNSEDSGKASGWNITNSSRQRSTTATTWDNLAGKLKIAVRGTIPPAISIADASAAENAGHLLFEVTLSRSFQNSVKVDFETISGGTATEGVDYHARGTYTHVILAGDRTAQMGFALIEDTANDAGETVKARLSNARVVDAYGNVRKLLAITTDEATGTITAPATTTTIVQGLTIGIQDATGDEDDGYLLFKVKLSKKYDDLVCYDFEAISGGTATEGTDYHKIPKATYWMAIGKKVDKPFVLLIDDSVNDNGETVKVKISNARLCNDASQTVSITRAEATGTIRNSDPLPRALMARFGRTAAVHVVEQVEERIRARRTPGMSARLAGRELRPGMTDDVSRGLLRQLGSLARSKAPVEEGNNSMAGFPGVDTGFEASFRTTGRTGVTPIALDPQSAATGPNWIGYLKRGFGVGDLLTGSSFELNRETGHGGVLSFWSRGARSQFTGREDRVTLDGRTATTMAGADYRKGRLVAGLSLAHSRGQGDYKGVGVGALASSVTGLYPWLGYQATDRITVWGVTGFGKGSLRLTPGTGGALETGLSMAMAAAGMRGELVAPVMGGFGMAFKTDALWVATSNAGLDGPAGSLAATRAVVTRFRAGLEASRGYDFRSGLSLQPSLEVGLRQDDGNAETGAGVDVAGGLIFSVPSRGIKADLRVRTLLMHQDQDYRERGVLVSFSYDPKPSTPLGMTVRLAPSWGGQARSAAEALWSRETMKGLGGRRPAAGARFDTELAYGLPVGGRLVGTPLFGIRTSATSRYYQLGYKLAVLQRGAMNFELGVAAQRRESLVRGTVDRGVTGRVTMTW